MIGGRLTVAGATAALLCLALTACSDDDSTAPPTSTTPAATTAPAPTTVPPTAPVRPSDQATPESAVALVRYFWEAYNYAYATYDTTPIEAISAPTCKFCASVISDIQAIKNRDGHSSGGQVTVIDAAAPPGDITPGTIVAATISQKSSTLRFPDGPGKVDRGWRLLPADFAMNWSSSQWKIAGVDTKIEDGERWEG